MSDVDVTTFSENEEPIEIHEHVEAIVSVGPSSR